MALGISAWREARETLQKLLNENEATLRDNANLRERYSNNNNNNNKAIYCLPLHGTMGF